MKKLKINRKVVANLSKTVQSNVIGGDGTFNTDDLEPLKTADMANTCMCIPTDATCNSNIPTVQCETMACKPLPYTTTATE